MPGVVHPEDLLISHMQGQNPRHPVTYGLIVVFAAALIYWQLTDMMRMVDADRIAIGHWGRFCLGGGQLPHLPAQNEFILKLGYFFGDEIIKNLFVRHGMPW